MKRRHRKHLVAGSEVDTGVREYGRSDVAEVEDVQEVRDVLSEALDVFSHNERRPEDFNHPPDYRRPQKGAPELVLPNGVDPHGPVLQLAKTGIETYGFGFVASVDTTKSAVSNRATEMAGSQLERIVNREGFGLIILVQRHADLLNERIERLRGVLGELTVPRLSVITMPGPEMPPPFEPLTLPMPPHELPDPGTEADTDPGGMHTLG